MPVLRVIVDSTPSPASASSCLKRAYPILSALAQEWNCQLIRGEEMLVSRTENGFVLIPEVMMSIHGIVIEETNHGLVLVREEDATTWEDFLFMRAAHLLASELDGHLYYEQMEKPLELEPANFETFEAYVNRVLANEDDVVKEMKRTWMYTHRKRAVR